MSEITFAKQFLATLDKRPIKLASDHVSDPRKYPNQSPYTLPRATHPFPRKSGPTSTQTAQSKSISVSLKPMRSGETVTLPAITLDTTIHEIKTEYAAKSGLQQDKIKLLLNKKPAADLKTLKDLGVEADVELSVMLMAGAAGTPRSQSPAVAPAAAAAPPAAAAATATPTTGDAMEIDSAERTGAPDSEEVAAQVEAQQNVQHQDDTVSEALQSEEFWDDLKGFLSQRLRDEAEGERLAKLFRGSVK